MITLSPPALVPVEATPFATSWSDITVTNFIRNPFTGVIPSQTISFPIKDVVGVPAYSAYTAFRLQCSQSFDTSTSIQWIHEDSISAPGYPTTLATLPITTNDIVFEFTPDFQNTEFLPVGNYTFTQTFRIQGLNSSGFWVSLTFYVHNTVLIVSEVGETPTFLNFNYATGETTATQSIALNGNWKLVISNYFTVSSATLGVTITPTDYGNIVEGSGLAEIVIGINNAVIDTLPNSQTTFQDFATIIDPTVPTVIGDILINVTIDTLISITPDNFNFSAVKGLQEPVKQYANINADVEFTIEHDPWLNVVQGEFTEAGVFLGNMSIVPISTEFMEPGTYTSELKLLYEIESEPAELIVPITYNLTGLMTSPYEENAFTLDNKFLEFNSENENTYLEIESTIKTFERFNPIPKTTVILDKLPLFKGYGKINFGQRIHQLMPELKEVNENLLQIFPAELTQKITEKNILDFSEIRVLNTAVQKYIAGLSYHTTSPFTFLDENDKKQRVTKTGYVILNFFLNIGAYTFEVFKNATLHSSSELLATATGSYSKKVSFENFTQGDVIKFVIKNPSSGSDFSISKEFVLIPESRISYQIHWQNEFKLESAMEFTGSYKLPNDYENITQTLYRDLVEVLQNDLSKKITKFTINTGWILKSDHETIDSILRSKKCWLKLGNEFISLTPISKSLAALDNERFLNSFDCEFQINRSYDEKNYTF